MARMYAEGHRNGVEWCSRLARKLELIVGRIVYFRRSCEGSSAREGTGGGFVVAHKVHIEAFDLAGADARDVWCMDRCRVD